MLSYKLRKRLIFFIFIFLAVIILIYITLKSLEENIVYFFSPTEIYEKENESFDKKIRIGGLVKKNSVNKKKDSIVFIITDLKNEIIVTFDGSLPNLFSEGKGIVAEGNLQDKKYFIADKILAKHDENYMPPEVYDALKKTND